MYRFHTGHCGLSTLAQHLTIGPGGEVWTGRSWELPPASAPGYNGNATSGPLMIELVGDFGDADALAGAQRQALVRVVALLQRKWGLSPQSSRLAWHPGDRAPGTDRIDYRGRSQEVDEKKERPAPPPQEDDAERAAAQKA